MDPLKPVDPRRLGDIELHGVLGEGGMGKVYFGITPDGERVAVKVIRADIADDTSRGEKLRARFDQEIGALRMVQGPRVASLVAAAPPGAERPWLAMEYVRGLNLKEYVKAHGPLAADAGAALGELLAEALTAIHVARLFHRDFKPANIILGPGGPKVIDFGLVKLTATPGDLTSSLERLGTPLFMPPEQVDSARDVTAAADVYALGATLLFALTGHYAYAATHGADYALLNAIMDPQRPPDLSGLPPSLAPLIASTLEYDPESRPTVALVGEELRNICDGAGLSVSAARIRLTDLTFVERPDDPPIDLTPPRPPIRRRRPMARIPSAEVAAVADRLRSKYATSGSL